MANTDLAQAVLTQLRATAPVTTAFGDTWNPATSTGVSKFFGDFSGQATEPYLVCVELGESYEFMTQAPGLNYEYLATGQMVISIYQADRQAARALGVLVCAALNDAPMVWTGYVLMLFRMSQASFVPVGTPGPGVPTVFNRVITFDYQYSGGIL